MKLQHIIVLASLTVNTSHTKRLILDLIDKLRSSQTKSISPSWEGIRRFDLIGTGKLPLQSHKLDTEFEGELLEDRRDEDTRRVYSGGQEDRVTRLPSQFSRNRGNPGAGAGLQRFPQDLVNTFRPTTGPADYRYNQDPETKIRESYDRFGFTWSDRPQRRTRRSPSPYNRIKIKIANPFYFSSPKRRRVRVKKIIPAPPPSRPSPSDRVGPQGFWETQNFDRNFFDPDLGLYDYTDDILQHLELLDTDVGGREPESLASDDIYQVNIKTET